MPFVVDNECTKRAMLQYSPRISNAVGVVEALFQVSLLKVDVP